MGRRIGAVLMLAVVFAAGCDQQGSTPIASAAGDEPAGPTGSAGPSASSGAITDPRQAGQAFVKCMRDRGQEIVDPPDPEDPRSAIRHELDVKGKGNDMQFQASLEACLPILPAPPPPSREQVKEDIAVDAALYAYSRCIQTNGVPNFPDLSSRGSAGPGPAWRTQPLPSIPPETERKCEAELKKVDAAQEAAARAHLKRRG